MHSFTFKTLNVFTLELRVYSAQHSRIWCEIPAFSFDSIKFNASKVSQAKRQVSQFLTQSPIFSPAVSYDPKKIFMSCSSLQSNRSKFTGNYTRLSGALQCRLDGSILWIIKRKQTGDEACCFIFFFHRIFF